MRYITLTLLIIAIIILPSCQSYAYWANASYSYFTITRYETAVIQMFELKNIEPITIENLTVYASCVEDGYNYLETRLKGYVGTLQPDEVVDVQLEFFDGWNYFTNKTVRCDFRGESPSVVEVDIVEAPAQ
jgi:hypothetical protein